MSVNSLDVAEQVGALMADMTVAEKAGQLTQYFYFNLPPSAEIEATQIGRASCRERVL